MYSAILQGMAISLFALVTAFPNPGDLIDTIRPHRTVVLSPTQNPSVIIVQPAAYDDSIVTVEPPDGLRCDARLSTTSTAVLEACAYQLSNYITSASVGEPLSTDGQVAGLGYMVDPKVEQARFALSQICRINWASNAYPSNTISQSCSLSL